MLANLVTPIVVDSGVPTPSTPPGPALQTMANCEMSPFSLVHAPTEDDLVEDLSTCRLPNRRGALQGQGPTSTPRKFLSRIFGGLGTSAVEKGKYKTITASGEPLDGEEGELVDEGCFVDAKDTFGFGMCARSRFAPVPGLIVSSARPVVNASLRAGLGGLQVLGFAFHPCLLGRLYQLARCGP